MEVTTKSHAWFLVSVPSECSLFPKSGLIQSGKQSWSSEERLRSDHPKLPRMRHVVLAHGTHETT